MKKLIEFAIPFKSFAGMLFAGFMILYMIGGIIFSTVTGKEFIYSIPFIFILQAIGLSSIISILWGIFFSNAIIKKWRFYKRHMMFELSLIALLGICYLIFYYIPTEWSKLWLIVAGIVVVFIIVLFSLCEMYFKKTGKYYTEMLRIYKENNL